MAVRKSEAKATTVVETKTAAKPAAKRTTARKTAAVKKAETKKVETQKAVILQYGGKEIVMASLMEQVMTIWTKELGKKEEEATDVKLYVKPEENTAYYVINEDTTGSIDLA